MEVVISNRASGPPHRRLGMKSQSILEQIQFKSQFTYSWQAPGGLRDSCSWLGIEIHRPPHSLIVLHQMHSQRLQAHSCYWSPTSYTATCSCPGWSWSGANCGSGSEPQELHQAEPEQVRAESFCCLSKASFCTTRAPFLLDSIHNEQEGKITEWWPTEAWERSGSISPEHN